METTEQYSLSISKSIINGQSTSDDRAFKKGFEPVSATLEEIADLLGSGYAIAPVYEKGIRHQNQFVSASFIAIDFDGPVSPSDALNNSIVKQHASLFYLKDGTLPHHPRFKILFLLEQPILEANKLDLVTKILASSVGADTSQVKKAPIVLGTENHYPAILESTLSAGYVAALLENADYDSKWTNPAYSRQLRSKKKLADQLFEGPSGNYRLADIRGPVTVYCPIHPNPKAGETFLGITHCKKRSKYLSCKVCKKTWWESEDWTDLFKDDFEETLIGLSSRESRHLPDSYFAEKTGFDEILDFTTHEEVKVPRFIVQNQRYLSVDKLNSGVTFIRSAKGTGKTEFLANLTKTYDQKFSSLEEFEEADLDDNEHYIDTEKSMLLIGHRQALIGQMCKRLNLNCYLEDRQHSQHENLMRKRRYGLCLDSLFKVKDKRYSLVIIDEVEQVLAHFLSGTMMGKRESVFALFSELLNKADKIVLLDADLGWVTFRTIKSILESSTNNNAYQLTKRFNFLLNTWRPQGHKIICLEGKAQALDILRRDLAMGKRVFICSNTKKWIKNLTREIASWEEAEDYQSISITSETSNSKEGQRFIKNAAVESLKYNVILASPSLGTGIDITFANNETHIDTVIGLFETVVNTHFDIDQQLARVRHPDKVCVWIDGKRNNVEFNEAIVAYDLQEEGLTDLANANYAIDVGNKSHEISPFIQFAARLVSQQRQSKNNLKANFLQYKHANGWNVQMGIPDYQQAYKWEKVLDSFIGPGDSDLNGLILNSQILNMYDFHRIQDRMSYLNLDVPRKWFGAYLRTLMERFYCQPIDEELIKLDRFEKNGYLGRYRNQIARYKTVKDRDQLLKVVEFLKLQDNTKLEQDQRLLAIHDWRTSGALIHALLKTTPIFDGEKFIDVEFCKVDLEEFADACTQLLAYIRIQIGMKVRADVKSRAVKQLGFLLRYLSLDTYCTRQQKIDGRKYYFYRLKMNGVESIEAILSRQAIFNELAEKDEQLNEIRYKGGWHWINQQYGFTYEQEQIDWLNGDPVTGQRSAFEGYKEWAEEVGLEGDKKGFLYNK